jgi:hypothetical protein
LYACEHDDNNPLVINQWIRPAKRWDELSRVKANKKELFFYIYKYTNLNVYGSGDPDDSESDFNPTPNLIISLKSKLPSLVGFH